jgi:hypothetical protein
MSHVQQAGDLTGGARADRLAGGALPASSTSIRHRITCARSGAGFPMASRMTVAVRVEGPWCYPVESEIVDLAAAK